MAEKDLRLIAIREQTLEDANFEVRIANAEGFIQSNGARANPRKVVAAAILDVNEYGSAFFFTGSEKLVLVGNNLSPGGDGIVVQDYQTAPGDRVGGPQIVETCYRLDRSVGGDIITPQEADDAAIAAIALVIMKPGAPQTEIDEALETLEQHRHIPRNPSAAPGSLENVVDWTLSPKGFKYNIYWDTNPGVTIETGNKIPDITSGPFTHTGLPHGVEHFYVVTAVSKVTTVLGVIETESVESPEVSATPLP